MQKFLSLLLVSYGFTALAAGKITEPFPKVSFEVGDIYDWICPKDASKPITPEMQKELNEKKQKFELFWNDKGPKLLRELTAFFGKPLKHEELITTLVLCPSTPSMSAPLLINARQFLDSAKSPAEYPASFSVSITFHELLHRFLGENFDESFHSPLLEKYKKESISALGHMHLNAIQALIYSRLGLESDLLETKKLDKLLDDPGYKRAWEIVEQEGYEVFIEELRSPGKPSRGSSLPSALPDAF